MEHEKHMRAAIALGKEGMDGNFGGPFGAVIVNDDMVIGTGFNRVTSTPDPTAHAEVTAIRDAAQKTGKAWLEGCRIYTSCQPCPMCLGSILWAHLDEIYYAGTEEDAARIGFDDAEFYRMMNFRFDRVRMNMHQLLRDEAASMMNEWLVKTNRRKY